MRALLFAFFALFTASNTWAVLKCSRTYDIRSPQLTYSAFNYRGQSIPYTEIYNDDASMSIKNELPFLKDSLLIRFEYGDHVTLWYQGVMLESKGEANLFLRSQQTSSRRITTVGPGLIFAIKDLPKDLPEKFEIFLENYQNQMTRTCVSSACDTVNALDIPVLDGKTYYKLGSLFDKLLTQVVDGKIELYSVRGRPQMYINNMREMDTKAALGTIARTAEKGAYFLPLYLYFVLEVLHH